MLDVVPLRYGTLQLLLTLLLPAASGCAHEVYTPSVGPQAKLSPDHAYLYGHFKVDAQDRSTWEDTGQAMGFAVTCGDGQRYVIRFSMTDPLQVIEIAPARCTVGLIFTDKNGDVAPVRRDVDRVSPTVYDFAAGNAYYLGDFEGSAHASGYWTVERPLDGYDATTTKMRAALPNLAQVPTQKRMILAKAPSEP